MVGVWKASQSFKHSCTYYSCNVPIDWPHASKMLDRQSAGCTPYSVLTPQSITDRMPRLQLVGLQYAARRLRFLLQHVPMSGSESLTCVRSQVSGDSHCCATQQAATRHIVTARKWLQYMLHARSPGAHASAMSHDRHTPAMSHDNDGVVHCRTHAHMSHAHTRSPKVSSRTF